MAPSPELGGQPKAPDKAGADQATNPTTEMSPSSSSSSVVSNSTNPQSSGTKQSSSAAAAGTVATSNPVSGSSSSNSNNNSSLGGPAATSTSAQAAPQQDSSKIDNMEESDLKALLEEAITYKRPKDREHKSATFNELLSKTEMEDQEQNFPFTSRAVQTKRASGRPTQGGSLQDLPEASLQDYYYSEFSFATDYYSNRGGFQQNFRRHHGSSSGASSGPGGGDRATNPRQKRTTSSVSSRQREGGSLPSNVNVECPFFNDVGHHHTTGTITKFKKREGGSKSDYGTMLLPLMTSAGAAELISAVAEVASNTGMCGGMKNTESQLIDGCGGGVGSGETVIDMGELESDETQHLLAHDALQQTLYDSGLDDYDGSGGDLYGNSTTTSGGSSTTGGAGSGCSAMKKIPRYPAASYTSHAKLEIGEPSSTVRPSSVHHVDKTVSLPLLESNKSVDITPIQLGTNYQAVKCFVSSDNSKSDQTKHVMMGTISANNTKYIATPSIGQMISQQKCLDENGNSVQQFNSGLGSSSSTAGAGSSLVGSGNSSSVGGIASGKKNRKPKSDRNTVLVIPEKIAGYRGKDHDIESLVCYIENKDKQKDSSKGGGGGGSGSNPKNGTVVKVASASVENGVSDEKVSKKKNEKKKEKAKLKKSNSLEELSSCSRKKQQAEEEENTQQNHVTEQQGSTVRPQEAESAVTLRVGKGNKKAQIHTSGSVASSASSTASSQSSKETSVNSGKRVERRSWGTEELSYLEDSSQQQSLSGEKPEEKPLKKESKKEAKESAETTATPTFNAGKKRDSLRMSVESLSAVSAAAGAETAEFHVVTKKKKMKKKAHSLFAEDTPSAATGSYSNATSNVGNRRNLTASQSYNLGSSTGRNSNISGKYQTSNSFTNDRDVYMNSLTSSNDVSRRKSTSSVPPSEKSDSSDADSVQSLPIEPSRKQQQQQQSHPGGSSRISAGVPQSYAEIARIPNADRINNNLLGPTSNSSTTPLDSSSVEKWPPVQPATSEDLAQALKSPSAFPELVPEASLQPSQQPQQSQPNLQQYQQHQYVNSSVNSVSSNNLGNNNKATYSQSLLIATTKGTEEDESVNKQQQRLATAASGKLVSSVNSEHSVNNISSNNSNNNNNNNNNNNTSSSSSSKLALHKSKSVDTNDIYYSNEQYPALEKTVKPVKVAPTVTTNCNSLLEPKTSSTGGGKVSPVAIAGQLQSVSSQPTTTPTATTTVISGNPTASNASIGAKKSKKKDSFMTTTTPVTTAPSIPPNEVESINNARNVAAIQTTLDAANNNPLLIENVDSVPSTDLSQNNGMLNRSPNGGLNLQQHPQSTPKNSSNSTSSVPPSTTTAITTKRSKKEKSATLSHNSVPASNAVRSNTTSATAISNHRPAVIIMNDNNESNSTSHEFTFGFDIDQELLFGDFQEDEVSMLDQQSSQHKYHQHQQKPSQHHSSSTDNVPSPTSNTSAQSTDLGYSSMQQSSASTASPTSSNSSQHKPHHHHYHNQQQQHQLDSYEMLNNSADPDTYRDSIEHKFHQPPPPVVPVMYTQPPPQLPPPHVLAAAQQQQQSARQPRPAAAGPNHYNQPPPSVMQTHMQQPPPPALPTLPVTVVVIAKQDNASNSPAIMSVPPPPLPPVVVPATIPVVQAVILAPAGPQLVAMNNTTTSSSNTSAVGCSSNNSSSSNIHTSLNNQTMASCSGSSSSINSCSSASLQHESKPQRQPVQQQQQQQQSSTQLPVREKMKEINLRFIAPEQLQTNHNHDKIVNFVGMAWEDVICGTNGSAKYFEGQ